MLAEERLMDASKRELRQQKRETKRAGGKHRRRQWKRGLADHPEDAPLDRDDFGRYSSAAMNGVDRDATRRAPQDGDRVRPDTRGPD